VTAVAAPRRRRPNRGCSCMARAVARRRLRRVLGRFRRWRWPRPLRPFCCSARRTRRGIHRGARRRRRRRRLPAAGRRRRHGRPAWRHCIRGEGGAGSLGGGGGVGAIATATAEAVPPPTPTSLSKGTTPLTAMATGGTSSTTGRATACSGPASTTCASWLAAVRFRGWRWQIEGPLPASRWLG